ncbi:MAG: hypothetical protein AAF092_08960 [Pseudomonadota bacterium]
MRRLACAVAAALMSAPVQADFTAVTFEELVGTSDVIVLGSLIEIDAQEPLQDGTIPRVGVIAVEEVLAGSAEGGVAIALPPQRAGGLVLSTDFEPPMNTPRLWLLPEAEAGVFPLDHPDRVRAVDQAELRALARP